MTGRGLGLGVFLPQGVNQEFAGVEPQAALEQAVRTAERAEQLGYDALWARDAVDTQPRREPHAVFDGWILLATVAAATSRARLGNFVQAAPAHNTGLLAKQAATLDVLSGGRLLLALDSGRHPAGHEAYGWERPGAAERAGALAEGVEALQRLWSEPRTTSEGEYVRLRGAHCYPKPLQGSVPLRLLAGGDRESTDLVARLADTAVWQGSPEDLARGRDELREACERLGRDQREITNVVMLECRLFEDRIERDRWLASPYVVAFWSMHPDNYSARNLVGTPDAVATRVQRYVDAGASELMVYFRDCPSTASLEALVTEVLPQVDVPQAQPQRQPAPEAVSARR